MKSSMVLIAVVLSFGLMVAPPAAIAQSSMQPIAQANESPDYVAIAEDLITDLATLNYGAAVQTFNTEQTTNVTQSSLSQTWQDIVAESGAFQQQTDVQLESDDASGTTLVIVTGVFENECRDLFVIMDATGEVIGLDAASGEPLDTCQ